MSDPIRILIKTTIPFTEDDWHVGRFALMRRHLESLRDVAGQPQYELVARDRIASPGGDDCDLAQLGGFDELWLIATDVTGALTAGDITHINEFRARGGGVFLTRDHQDLGACLTRLGSIGTTQHFHSVNPEDLRERQCCDDRDTPSISWPNYHSGANGDLQPLEIVLPLHALLRCPSGEPMSRWPAHPHEGTVGVPRELESFARVVVRGRSQTSGTRFNLCVAVDEPGAGRVVSDSSFHHLADYNWDPRLGCPSFVDEPPGSEVLRDPHALDDVQAYVSNAAAWLARRI